MYDFDDINEFVLLEQIKNRLATMIKNDTQIKLDPKSLDTVAPMVRAVMQRFGEIHKADGAPAALSYLTDVAGYYMVLTEELCKLCNELIERAE